VVRLVHKSSGSIVVDSKSVHADVPHLCSKHVSRFAFVQDLRVLGDIRVLGLECLGDGLIGTVCRDQRVLAAGIKIVASDPARAVKVVPVGVPASPASPRPPRDEGGGKESQLPQANTTQLSAGISLENSAVQR
jgi:hypothetical protein